MSTKGLGYLGGMVRQPKFSKICVSTNPGSIDVFVMEFHAFTLRLIEVKMKYVYAGNMLEWRQRCWNLLFSAQIVHISLACT